MEFRRKFVQRLLRLSLDFTALIASALCKSSPTRITNLPENDLVANDSGKGHSSCLMNKNPFFDNATKLFIHLDFIFSMATGTYKSGRRSDITLIFFWPFKLALDIDLPFSFFDLCNFWLSFLLLVAVKIHIVGEM